MDKVIQYRNEGVYGEIRLPLSKSISNRMLIIYALAAWPFPLEKLSDSGDTLKMLELLRSPDGILDVDNAGTVMRFLTAYLAQKEGKKVLTGSARMKKRPIHGLVAALNGLGAQINYAEEPGYPPLLITGVPLKGGEITPDASVSSQFVSALMLIAPYMEKGLVIQLKGNSVSRPYIDMTASIMSIFGADVRVGEQAIQVRNKPYFLADYVVEPDWSAASYFYEWLAVAEKGELKLLGLREDSIQGDCMQREIWELLGVSSAFTEDGVLLSKKSECIGCLEYDFTGMPDLVPSFAVACCLKNIPFVFHGVGALKYKETDRIEALIRELGKLGYMLRYKSINQLEWDGNRGEVKALKIDTYGDHRMAMAFAPAAMQFPGLTVMDSGVVKKSFPGYWQQLSTIVWP